MKHLNQRLSELEELEELLQQDESPTKIYVCGPNDEDKILIWSKDDGETK